MNIFKEIIPGLSKGASWLVNFFKHADEVDAQLAKLAPSTKAAILATFYDTIKTVEAGAADAAAISTGNTPAAISLSVQTWSLIQGVWADAKNDASVIKQDLVALGILPNTTPAQPTTPAKA